MDRPVVYPFIRYLAREETQTGNAHDVIRRNWTYTSAHGLSIAARPRIGCS